MDTFHKGRILVVSSIQSWLVAVTLSLIEARYDIICAESIKEANIFLTDSLKSGNIFCLALIDLIVGEQSGVDLMSRLKRFTEINIISVINDQDVAAASLLSFKPDDIIIRRGNRKEPTEISEFERATLVGLINKNAKPIRKQKESVEVQMSALKFTEHMSGLTDLTPFTHEITSEDGEQVEKMTLITAKDKRWVNFVIYPGYPGDNVVPIALPTTIGCPIGCRFCKIPCSQRNGRGHIVKFVRPLTTNEMITTVYEALSSSRVSELLKSTNNQKLVVNFTTSGDGLVYNLKNCAEVIVQLAKIEKPQPSFIITSVGSENKLEEYLARYIKLPRVTHYWSVNSTKPTTRTWLMPGTKGQSLQKMRDLYQKIADLTGQPVTASFALFKGINDNIEDAKRISRLFKDRPFRIKLMAGCPGSLKGVQDISKVEVEHFMKLLKQAGLKDVRFREIYGIAQHSGCGNTIPSWNI